MSKPQRYYPRGRSEPPLVIAGPPRRLSHIAMEIKLDWKKPYFVAVPYLSAMAELEELSDFYGLDSAESIVRYFLANAQTWRGETARRIKKELQQMLKLKK